MNIEELEKIACLSTAIFKDSTGVNKMMSIWNGFGNSENKDNLYIVNHEDDVAIRIPEDYMFFIINAFVQDLDLRRRYLNKIEKSNEQTK